MIASGIQTNNPVNNQTDVKSETPDGIDQNDFNNVLEEMQKRGFAQIQLTLLPGGKLQESMEEVKNINFDLKQVPGESLNKEEDNLLTFKNESLEELKGDKKNLKLESNDLFLSQREAVKNAGKNQGINNFNKIFNIKKQANADAANEEANILSLMEGKNEPGEVGKSEAAKTDKLQFRDTKELFNWISKMIAKNSIPKGQALNLAIKDGALGQFNILAQSMGENGKLNMAILAQSQAGRDFFAENENQLMKSLQNAGLKVADFKVQLAGSNNTLNNDMANLMNDSREGVAERFEENLFQREELDQDSRRRQRIWEEMMDNRAKGA